MGCVHNSDSTEDSTAHIADDNIVDATPNSTVYSTVDSLRDGAIDRTVDGAGRTNTPDSRVIDSTHP